MTLRTGGLRHRVGCAVVVAVIVSLVASAAQAAPAVRPGWKFERILSPVETGSEERVGEVAFDGRRWWAAGARSENGGGVRLGQRAR